MVIKFTILQLIFQCRLVKKKGMTPESQMFIEKNAFL
jgi:hypothetical protein